MAFNTILVETRGRVGLITLNRPDALNALNAEMLTELTSALDDLEADDKVGCIVLTGSAKAFAAGADIKEMQELSFSDVQRGDFAAGWHRLSAVRKPVIAAVAGYALGGGCELAMMCDFIIAGDTARFGQPEITLGLIPGIGGTQRLTRLVGKSKAMEMCLTGRVMEAEEAERAGLVSRVVAADGLIDEAVQTGQKIAGFSAPAVEMAKEAVDRAHETTLAEGLLFERRLFHSLFATEDRKEGIAAFVAKRSPRFKHR